MVGRHPQPVALLIRAADTPQDDLPTDEGEEERDGHQAGKRESTTHHRIIAARLRRPAARRSPSRPTSAESAGPRVGARDSTVQQLLHDDRVDPAAVEEALLL